MIYLSGAIKSEYTQRIPGTERPFGSLVHARRHELHDAVSLEGSRGIGFIHTPNMGNRQVPGALWGADNGCFTKPETFDLGAYCAWLAGRDLETCLFATAPDWLGDWCSTLDRYYETRDAIAATGVPVALVAQDGLECYADRIDWTDVDALFIGGSTAWKLSEDAAYVVEQATAQGPMPWIHMGRVNSGRRIQRALAMGCDSADGTYLAFAGAGGVANVLRWLTPGDQDQLELGIAA